MYHPPDLGTNDNARDEFIELHNLTSTSVPLIDPASHTNTWRLRGAVDFDFPTNVSLPPRGFLLVVSFDPRTNGASLADFQAKYNSSAPLFGPYRGQLDNSSDDLKLHQPDPPQTTPGDDFGLVPYVLADRVNYRDAAPWPDGADGAGASLQRLNVATYGNEATNWFASGFTPGRSYLANQPDPDTDQDGMPDDWENLHGLQVNANDANEDPDGDGMTNLEEYFAGTHPQIAGSLLRLEALRNGADVWLRFNAQSNHAYAVQFRSNLLAGSWQLFSNLATQTVSQAILMREPAVTVSPRRYYRLVTPMVP